MIDLGNATISNVELQNNTVSEIWMGNNMIYPSAISVTYKVAGSSIGYGYLTIYPNGGDCLLPTPDCYGIPLQDVDEYYNNVKHRTIKVPFKISGSLGERYITSQDGKYFIKPEYCGTDTRLYSYFGNTAAFQYSGTWNGLSKYFYVQIQNNRVTSTTLTNVDITADLSTTAIGQQSADITVTPYFTRTGTDYYLSTATKAVNDHQGKAVIYTGLTNGSIIDYTQVAEANHNAETTITIPENPEHDDRIVYVKVEYKNSAYNSVYEVYQDGS